MGKVPHLEDTGRDHYKECFLVGLTLPIAQLDITSGCSCAKSVTVNILVIFEVF